MPSEAKHFRSKTDVFKGCSRDSWGDYRRAGIWGFTNLSVPAYGDNIDANDGCAFIVVDDQYDNENISTTRSFSLYVNSPNNPWTYTTHYYDNQQASWTQSTVTNNPITINITRPMGQWTQAYSMTYTKFRHAIDTLSYGHHGGDEIERDWDGAFYFLATELPVYKSNDPMLQEKCIAYIQSGDYSGAENAEDLEEKFYAKWTAGYTVSNDTLYSLACDCPQFYDPASKFYGAENTGEIVLAIQYHIGSTLTSIYRKNYSYGTTWNDSLANIIGQSNLDIANKIATKLADLAGVDSITMQFYLKCVVDDVTYSTAIGYITYDHASVEDYGFYTAPQGDTIEFVVGEVLSDDDSDTTNPEHTEETSDDTPAETVPDTQGAGLLTRTYTLTPSEAQGIGSFLWGATFIQNIKLLNTSPIENIVSCKLYPLALGGSDAEVVIGNVATGTQAKLETDNLIVHESTHYTLSEFFSDNLKYLNYAPYTKVEIFLPFVGFKELPVDLVMGSTIYIKWIIDIITGTLQTNIHSTIGGKDRHLFTFNSNIGIDIPLTAQNMAQIENAFIQNAIGGGTALMSGNPVQAVTGAIGAIANVATTQHHTQTTGTPAPATAVVSCLEPYIVITRPKVVNIGGTQRSTYKKLRGCPCYEAKTLGSLSGYTVVENPDIKADGATISEINAINALLAHGVYLGNEDN